MKQTHEFSRKYLGVSQPEYEAHDLRCMWSQNVQKILRLLTQTAAKLASRDISSPIGLFSAQSARRHWRREIFSEIVRRLTQNSTVK